MIKANLWQEIHGRFKLKESKKSIALFCLAARASGTWESIPDDIGVDDLCVPRSHIWP